MKHGLLHGSYDVTIDNKNRLLIPSEIRRSIVPERDGEAFFVIIGINRKPWLYTEKLYEEMAQQPAEFIPSEDIMAFDQMWFGQARLVEWDSAGRILLPDKILKKTATNKEVSFVGMRDHCEIWNRGDWAAREEELDRQRFEIALRAKQLRQPPLRDLNVSQ